MKSHLIIFPVLVAPLLSLVQTSPKGFNLNDKAPEFSADDQQGKLITVPAELKKTGSDRFLQGDNGVPIVTGS